MQNVCTTDQVIYVLNCLEIECISPPVFRSNKLLFDIYKAKLYLYSVQMNCLKALMLILSNLINYFVTARIILIT